MLSHCLQVFLEKIRFFKKDNQKFIQITVQFGSIFLQMLSAGNRWKYPYVGKIVKPCLIVPTWLLSWVLTTSFIRCSYRFNMSRWSLDNWQAISGPTWWDDRSTFWKYISMFNSIKFYLFACWVIFFMLLMSSADFFSKLTFLKSSFRNIRVSNRLDPDQDQCSVGSDLGPNCLQGLSADDKSGS